MKSFQYPSQRHVYMVALGFAAIVALVGTAGALGCSGTSGAGDASVVDQNPGNPGYRIPLPRSLDELTGNADIVVTGRVVKRGAETDVPLGESSPLGEKQVVHQIVLPVVTYTIDVSEYLVGSGPNQVKLQVPLEVEARDKSAFSPGESRIWFLEPEPAWKLGGFSLNYGEGSVLTDSGGAIRFGGPTGPVVPFLDGMNLAALSDVLRAK